jgi:hypothetical protein
MNMSNDRVNNTVKPRRKNKPCGYISPNGASCIKQQQYVPVENVHRYCHVHFREWSAANVPPSAYEVPAAQSTSVVILNTTTTGDESSAPIIAPSEGGVHAGSTLAVESNTRTTGDEYSAPITDSSEICLPARSTSAVEPNTTTTGNESAARNIVASERDVPAGSTSAVEPNSTTVAGESFTANIAATSEAESTTIERVRVVNAELTSNTTDMDTLQTIDTAIDTNSPQSRAITSISATQLTPEILALINRQIQENIRQYEGEVTKMKRSYENLKNKFNSLQMRKKRRITIPNSVTTISTVSECQNRMVHFSNEDNGFIINAGLKNVGNSCYLNAYLQVIASLNFLPDCLSRRPTLSPERFPLYFSFATVISSMVMNTQQKPIVDPQPFIDTFTSACHNFQNVSSMISLIFRNDGQLLTFEHLLNNC